MSGGEPPRERAGVAGTTVISALALAWLDRITGYHGPAGGAALR